MGAGIASTISYVVSEEAWAKTDRGPKIRHLFGLYRSTDCWAVMRKFRQIDDGNGYVSFDELQQLLCLPEFHLFFIWDVYSQQNELIDSREFLTMVCVFSSATLEEKGRFLISLFDGTQTGRCTGAELGQLCVMVLTVLAKCTGALVKPKDVVPKLRAEFRELVPEYETRAAEQGNDQAWHKARVVGQIELDRILPTIASAYQALPLAGPPPEGAAPPPSETWASAPVKGAQAAAEARRANASEKSKAQSKVGTGRLTTGLQVTQPSKQKDLAHIAWLRKLDEDEAPAGKAGGLTGVAGQDAQGVDPLAPAHSWMVLHGKDFAGIAKDVKGFRALFAKCISQSLGLPSDCIEVVNVYAHGCIVVQFVLRPSGRGDDSRSARVLLQLLEQQLGNPHSAFRKGPFGVYLDRAELTASDPRCASVGVGGVALGR
mmetsp:Transcript_156643/g.480594  ORF Transcript_156643/g.480594 Transcript_156643/m.480594 type:complete len:431 (-) Transcript_156643:49-1341(-)